MAVGSKDKIGVCATTHKWKIIQLENGEYSNCKLMTRMNIGDMSESIGVVLSATNRIRLPMEQQHLFEFFINNKRRSQWDVLSNNGLMQQLVHSSKDSNLNSDISLLSANVGD
ncbi:hypothetical protein H5410_050425 [Solanum commersonii]|uniref:HD-Zip IV C-terminal domain-containing protein n=1 Tax=Solanum commersonii TaxID=4109 RepID=A0A9J5WXX0_SOLCO|nr:hypothetical protein H5410_050425 [Solanum commersonii]